MDPFTRLGDDIQDRWTAARNDLDRFPAIAAAALRDHALHQRAGFDDLARWTLSATRWLPQTPGQVGQPPVPVYMGSGFTITALTWLDATTEIHQHGFSGAFQVFAGSSLHSRYDFEQREKIDARLLVGEIRCRDSELLRTGDVREIGSGRALIHSLFHLDHPSVSIVVQSVDEPVGPQFTYHKPFIAIDPFHEPQPQVTQLRMLQTLCDLAHPELAGFFELALARSDAWGAFRILELAGARCTPELTERLIAAARHRHGDWIDLVPACLTERRRIENITLRRARTTDPEERFLLALLLNLPDRAAILDTMRLRFPAREPVTALVEIVGRMSQAGSIGMDFNEVSLAVLERLLHGDGDDAVLAALAHRHGEAAVRAQESGLRALLDELRASVMLAPLFADKEARR
ncbi:hypothetical protein [Azospirillum sp. sgz301742]